ncbi:hypothetical protein ACHAWF_013286 [Thalassiosira exigua]
MARGKKKHDQNDASDSISDISHDDSASVVSNMSKSSAFKARFGKFGKKKAKPAGGSGGGGGSVGGASRGAKSARSTTRSTPQSPGAAQSVDGRSGRGTVRSAGGGGDARSVGSARSRQTAGAGGSQVDEKRLSKDAKSRFNIGLIYLKTGDYSKARENLEHSLYCHIQISGHDHKAYKNDTLFSIAGVREKLGDCYVADPSVADKAVALDHYDESLRLLKSVDPEDAPDNIGEMRERVEEKLKSPEVSKIERAAPRQRTSGGQTGKYQMKGNEKAQKLMGVGAAGGAAAGAAAARGGGGGGGGGGGVKAVGKRETKKGRDTVLGKIGLGKLQDAVDETFDAIHDLGHNIKDGINEGLGLDDSSHNSSTASGRGSLRGKEVEEFEVAMDHLRRDNHRTALNYLMSLEEKEQMMKNDDYRTELAACMIKVAESSLEANKEKVATDAFEEAYTILKATPDNGGENSQEKADNLKLARRGCLRGHKTLAANMEGIRGYEEAIQQRTRVYQLLDEDGRCAPACSQLIRIPYLHREREDHAKAAVTLSDAVRRLHKGVRTPDLMPKDRIPLLIKCYRMRAICYAKSKKWNDALSQYDELLPLVAKNEGQGSEEYNSATIHKAALLVTMGNHRLAASTVEKYLKTAELQEEMHRGQLIVSEGDHLLALDTCAATNLKLGNIDAAVKVFERKLAFVKTRPGKDEQRADTMHKLGCLYAYKKQHEKALKMLDDALSTRKVVYDGRHHAVFESTWAVAATNHVLGDNEKALKDYSTLLEKMNKVEGTLPIDSVIIHTAAGKLFFDDGKVDRAVSSFKQALQTAETSGNQELTPQIMLNLANSLSAKGDHERAMDLYSSLLKNKSLKKTKIFFLTQYNKSLLMVDMGEVDPAKEILHRVADTKSSAANEVRGKIYLTLGNLAVKDGEFPEALEFYDKAMEAAQDDDFIGMAQIRKHVGMAHTESGQLDRALETFEDLLEDLSREEEEIKGGRKKDVALLKAEVWNCLAKVYKKKDDLKEAKNYAKLGESPNCFHVRANALLGFAGGTTD